MPWSRPSVLQRTIEKLFGAQLRPGEGRLVALLTLDVFLLLTAYYVLKIVREPLVLLEGGVVGRNSARGAQAAILLLIVPAYGLLANRYNPRRLVNRVFGFFLATLLSFPLLSALHVPIGSAFFVWLGIFSITTVAQFWSLANDLFSEADGKRLFPIIAAGGTLGGVVGAQIVVHVDQWLGPMSLVFVAAAMLASCIVITQHVVERVVNGRAVAPRTPDESIDPRGGFRLLLSDRYLLLIGIGVVLSNLINTTGDQIMALLIDQRASHLVDRQARGRLFLSFYGDFQTWIGVLTAVLQIFVVGRVLRIVGVAGSLLVLPVLVMGGYGALGMLPLLGVARGFKVVENSVDYSIQNTLQQVLFLPTSRDAKYKAKAASDTFLVRVGDLGSWALVFVGLHLGWGGGQLSLANVVVAGLWLIVAVEIGRRHRRLSSVNGEPLASPLPAPA